MVSERRKKVLIVDDESGMVSILQRIVLNAGYESYTASTGQEALEKIQNEAPDLVLLDLVMPGLTGFETCRRIRENEATKNVPVFIVSALRSGADSDTAADSGATEFINKPFDAPDLAKRIRMRLGSPFKL